MVEVFHTALITGASGGLGMALAQRLAKEKIALLLTGRNEQKLAEVVASVKNKVAVESLTADLATDVGSKCLCNFIRHHAPNLVINNAGYGLYGAALSYRGEEQRDLLRVNGEAVLELTLAAARAMISKGQRGTIVNISSAAGSLPFPSFAVYAASKAFVNSLSSSLDCELSPYGVRVLVSSPGMIDTPFRWRSGASKSSLLFSFASLTPTYVAELIWRQVSKGQQQAILDWRYRFLCSIARLLPRCLVAAWLQRTIQQRIDPRPLLLD